MIKPELFKLSNGVMLEVINMGDQDLSRLDVGFEGGRCDGLNNFVSEMMVSMLREGTGKLEGQDIAERLDFNGSWLANEASAHRTLSSIYTINRTFADSLSVLCEIIENPIFPESALNVLKQRAALRMQVNLQKVAYIASIQFMKKYFGENHNLGMIPDKSQLDALDVDCLKSFYRQWYSLHHMHVILSGKVSDKMIAAVDSTLGNISLNPVCSIQSKSDAPVVQWQPDLIKIEKPDACQSAIYMAMPAVSRSHPDYIPLRILVTALGGYFGGRLMTNIREDKGYTYGIYSALYGYRDSSFTAISLQCDNRYSDNVIEEIRKEVTLLRNEPIGTDELQLVKNHMKSDLAQILETPFSVADYRWVIINNKMKDDYFDNQLRIIDSISPKDLLQIAERYFNIDNALTIVAGHNK